MISNPKLKKIFQTYVFGVVSIINKRIRHDKRKIILYSNMGFRDNVKSLYDYLIEQKYNEQYEIICCCNDFKRWSFVNIPNVKFVSCVKGFFYYFFAGYVFYSFGKIPIVPGINQKTIQLWHGSPYKAADAGMLKGHSWKHQYYSFSVATSRTFAKIWSRYFSMPLDHVLIGGQPRSDILYKSWPEYDFGDYKKLVLWAPTFRYSSKMGYQDVEDAKIVPILHSEDFIKINGYDEYFEGWGSEDKDLAARLQNSGCQKRYLKFAGIVYHLWHEQGFKYNEDKNLQYLEALNTRNSVRCMDGVDKYL